MTIPDRKLVGKNAKIEDDIYRDDYLRALNQLVTVDEVFGKYREKIKNGKEIIGDLVYDIFNKKKHEAHLVSLVMHAASAREWVAVVREPGKHIDGLDEVTEKCFGYVTDHKGKKFLLPSLAYVAYCNDKLK